MYRQKSLSAYDAYLSLRTEWMMSLNHYRVVMAINSLMLVISFFGCFVAWFDDTRIGTSAWATLIFFLLGLACAVMSWRSEEGSSRERSTIYLSTLLLAVSLLMMWVTVSSPQKSVFPQSDASRTVVPSTSTPMTPYNPGSDVTIWSTIDPQSPTETEQSAPTTTRPPATTTPRTTTAPRPRTTTEDPPPAQQEAPPADQPSDPGSAFGSTGQGGDEPSSSLNDQSNSGSVEQPG